MNQIRVWLANLQQRLAYRRMYRESDAGFEYALSVLRTETDPVLHAQLEGQANADRDDAFCMGMRIAIYGWQARANLPPPQEDADKVDAERFRWFMGARTSTDELVSLHSKSLCGDEPSLDDWRAAIDAARLTPGGQKP